jgi:hypothetical protein
VDRRRTRAVRRLHHSRNQCQFCTTAQQAFAASCTGDDVLAVRAAGVDDVALEEAVRISVLFQVINRIRDPVGAGPLEGPSLDLARPIVMGGGYKLPPTIRWLSRGR